MIDVLIPDGLKPKKVEIEAAWILAKYFGTTVEFLRPRNKYKEKTPDFKIGQMECELKTPISHKTRQIILIIKEASLQSDTIIINGKKTKILDKKLEEICRRGLNKNVKRIILITKDRNKVIDIK